MTEPGFNRRDFVRLSLGAAGTMCFPLLSRTARAAFAVQGDPHFFLQIMFPGGMDPTYLFDARPLALTQAGVIQNYMGAEPTEWAGTNGGRSFATRLVEPLKPYRDRFSVMNGVLMAMGFDGHDQNMNFLFAGDPFGGESYIPHLNRLATGSEPTPLDAVTAGFLFANLTNGGASVPLSADSAEKLVNRLKQSTPLTATNPLYAFINRRMAANAAGGGAFSLGAAAMKSGYDQAPAFASMLTGLQLDPAPAPSPAPSTGGGGLAPTPPSVAIDTRYLSMCLQLFKQGVTRCATFATSTAFDAHDPKTAASQPDIIGQAAQVLADVFTALSTTPYDASRSFLDVTTVVAASEFGRTLRQKGNPIDKTGTDHNPLSNSILIGGKGIKGGQLIGQSDTQAAGETLSKAHLAFDPVPIKMMGRPFDFATGRPRADLPDSYKASDYLGMASVANSIYSLFGVDPKYWRKLERNATSPAPLVPGLLT